jgi:flagella basal body P-ring formation protein FlgA
MRAKFAVRIFVLAVSFLALASLEAAGAEVSVELPSVIEARDGWFYLGEYAEIDGEPEIAASVSMAVVRHDGSFTRADVIDALAQTEAAGMSVAIKMPDAVKVLPEPGIASRLRDMTAWKWRIGVEVIPGTWNELMSGYRDYSLPPKILPGARTIAIRLEDAEGRRFKKQVKLTWYQPVVFSPAAIEKGEDIKPSSLGSRIEKAGMLITNFSSPEQLAGASARKRIGPRAAIETGDISQDNFVRAGTTVTMVAKVNGLGVEVKGVAMQRGGLGDVIRVKNLASKKVLSATIVGTDRVEINP